MSHRDDPEDRQAERLLPPGYLELRESIARVINAVAEDCSRFSSLAQTWTGLTYGPYLVRSVLPRIESDPAGGPGRAAYAEASLGLPQAILPATGDRSLVRAAPIEPVRLSNGAEVMIAHFMTSDSSDDPDNTETNFSQVSLYAARHEHAATGPYVIYTVHLDANGITYFALNAKTGLPERMSDEAANNLGLTQAIHALTGMVESAPRHRDHSTA